MSHQLQQQRLEWQPDPTIQAELPAAELAIFPPDDWAHAYFTAYVSDQALGSKHRAARIAHTTTKTIDKRLADDAAFQHVHELATDALRDAFIYVAADYAKNGTLEPLINHGDLVALVRKRDPRFLQWWLERMAPEHFHLPTRIEHTNPDTPGAFKFQLGDGTAALPQGE